MYRSLFSQSPLCCPSATGRELSVHFTIIHLSYLLSILQDSHPFYIFHLCPLRSESQRAESITSLVIRSRVPKVRIQHWQYCWRMLPLLYNNIFYCCPLLQLSGALNNPRLPQTLYNDPTTLVPETLLFFKSIPAISLGCLRQEGTETHFPTHGVLTVILRQMNGPWLWLLASPEWKTTPVLLESQSTW